MAATFLASVSGAESTAGGNIPHLEKRGPVTQLIVDGKPYLALAGEVGNSSSSSLEYMKPIWPKLTQMHLNTVLTPVSWELIEPEEGKFDFTLVDGLIRDARRHHLHLVLLWFGTWKNMVSTYAPVWVRRDTERFPLWQDERGNKLPILSTFGDETRKADARAFAALMRHLRKADARDQTVVMMQIENEVGGPGGARDQSPAASEAFGRPVPQELMDYLQKQKNTLLPDFLKLWEAAGSKTSGTWEEVFGRGMPAHEAFMTWNYARFIGQVIAAGKAEYPLPMFVNASVGRADGKLGTYPCGGPMPLFLDIWRAGAPKLDMISPDIYVTNFTDWCARYTQSENPLFIPETRANPAHAFLAIGQYNAIGISPFGIEREADPASALSKSYDILGQLAPLILENQGKGTMRGVVVDAENPTQKISLGNYTLNVHFGTGRLDRPQAAPELPAGAPPRAGGSPVAVQPPNRGYAVFIALGADEYIAAGSGVLVTFSPNSPGPPISALASVEEGAFVKGRWTPGRRLNGDEIMLSYGLSELAAQNQTGSGLRLSGDAPRILRVKLFRYR